jgi:hypothetical protein
LAWILLFWYPTMPTNFVKNWWLDMTAPSTPNCKAIASILSRSQLGRFEMKEMIGSSLVIYQKINKEATLVNPWCEMFERNHGDRVVRLCPFFFFLLSC